MSISHWTSFWSCKWLLFGFAGKLSQVHDRKKVGKLCGEEQKTTVSVGQLVCEMRTVNTQLYRSNHLGRDAYDIHVMVICMYVAFTIIIMNIPYKYTLIVDNYTTCIVHQAINVQTYFKHLVQIFIFLLKCMTNQKNSSNTAQRHLLCLHETYRTEVTYIIYSHGRTL